MFFLFSFKLVKNEKKMAIVINKHEVRKLISKLQIIDKKIIIIKYNKYS